MRRKKCVSFRPGAASRKFRHSLFRNPGSATDLDDQQLKRLQCASNCFALNNKRDIFCNDRLAPDGLSLVGEGRTSPLSCCVYCGLPIVDPWCLKEHIIDPRHGSLYLLSTSVKRSCLFTHPLVPTVHPVTKLPFLSLHLVFFFLYRPTHIIFSVLYFLLTLEGISLIYLTSID